MGANEIDDAAIAAKTNMLKWKRIHYQLRGDACQYAFKHSEELQRQQLLQLAAEGNDSGIKQWIEENSQGSMRFWSYRKLRDRGKDLNIPRWSRLDRIELLDAIKRKEREIDEARTSTNSNPDGGLVETSGTCRSVGTGIPDANG